MTDNLHKNFFLVDFFEVRHFTLCFSWSKSPHVVNYRSSGDLQELLSYSNIKSLGPKTIECDVIVSAKVGSCLLGFCILFPWCLRDRHMGEEVVKKRRRRVRCLLVLWKLLFLEEGRVQLQCAACVILCSMVGGSRLHHQRREKVCCLEEAVER